MTVGLMLASAAVSALAVYRVGYQDGQDFVENWATEALDVHVQELSHEDEAAMDQFFECLALTVPAK